MREVWKNIEGYAGIYQISNLGNVKSLDRYVICRNGSKRFCIGKELKQRIDKDGYKVIELNKNGKRRFCHVHRLVAKAFIYNDDPSNKTQINHKNEFEKWNNFSENLEWCTPKENSNYGSRTKRVAKSQSKQVYQFNLDNSVVKLWDSVNQVENALGFSHSNIVNCCNSRRKTAYGFVWRYL